MKKKVIMFTAMTVFAVCITASVFAISAFKENPRALTGPLTAYGYCGGGYGIMWDQNGNFLDRDEFEDNLDELIENGYINPEDKDFFLERYDWCAAYGGGTLGINGIGRGIGRRGAGCGMGRGR